MRTEKAWGYVQCRPGRYGKESRAAVLPGADKHLRPHSPKTTAIFEYSKLYYICITTPYCYSRPLSLPPISHCKLLFYSAPVLSYLAVATATWQHWWELRRPDLFNAGRAGTARKAGRASTGGLKVQVGVGGGGLRCTLSLCERSKGRLLLVAYPSASPIGGERSDVSTLYSYVVWRHAGTAAGHTPHTHTPAEGGGWAGVTNGWTLVCVSANIISGPLIFAIQRTGALLNFN